MLSEPKGALVNMYVVTGGAGFIGSNVVGALAARGDRVVVNDRLGKSDKWKNIGKHYLHDIVPPEELATWLAQHASSVQGIIHLGAISSTTEKDADLLALNNFKLSLVLWRWCAAHRCPFLYASSAATYGDGAFGFTDDDGKHDALANFRPLNAYAWSKHAFDRRAVWAARNGESAPPKWAGLKFFNVYGPNEYHKGDMRSVVARTYSSVAEGKPLLLYRSHHPDYSDGGQMRDFIYVKDCVSVILWMLDNTFPCGLYNVGSGQARSWLDVGRSMFRAMGLPERLEFVPMPDTLLQTYQYFTQADMSKLRRVGCALTFHTLENGVQDFIINYLSKADRWA
jgi:ADP-L-glycero-D-manno-heptose 6-epimerase